METTLGGDRLGSGNKQKIQMKNYERSSHSLSYLWRSSMASGTLVPFMSEVGLPGDSFDIELNCEIMTLPTIGPLFGSYKVQLDVFQCPIRLYNGKLHMNMLNIGMNMSQIKLPQMRLKHYMDPEIDKLTDNSQINPSSIFNYLNIKGLGVTNVHDNGLQFIQRDFNAVPYLAYWDIYKNYYANKQEERGMVIHNPMTENNRWKIEGYSLHDKDTNAFITDLISEYNGDMTNTYLMVSFEEPTPKEGRPVFEDMTFDIDGGDATVKILNYYRHARMEENWQNFMRFEEWMQSSADYELSAGSQESVRNTEGNIIQIPQIKEFPLSNIDDMRKDILADVKNVNAFKIDENTYAPYGLPFKRGTTIYDWCKLSPQEGLALKTYQSDLFNNWISTEWIDGTNGVNEVTAISTVGDSFTIDALNLANKVYNMLNRIAISGGSYDDWLDAVYTEERAKSVESPIYQGSLIKELGFEEVISTADTEVAGNEQPLGTLAGRGRLTNKNKGGKIKIKVSEPCYIMGIVSITPRIDYSQGNKWDMNLKTINDFHKPALDEIGYQDLITDQMAWFDTIIDEETGNVIYKSAGKQPAWINYMTNVNQIKGNFAEQEKEMFMVLNRRYEKEDEYIGGIGDLTTYIDPTKYNHIFAQTSLDAQNFWVQISNDIFARRKMSAKVIPNL